MSDLSHIPTPRTDARRKSTNGLLCGAANLDLCDQIERELTAALAEVERLEAENAQLHIMDAEGAEKMHSSRNERDALRREQKETHAKTDSMFLSMSKQLDVAISERDEARRQLAEERALIAEWRDALQQIAHDGDDAQRRSKDALSIEKEQQ